MASTFQPINKAAGLDNYEKGTRARWVDMIVQNADYSSGFAITPLAVGFRQIFSINAYGFKNGAGAAIADCWAYWDFVNGKLRVSNKTSEANAAALFTNNSVIRLKIEGV